MHISLRSVIGSGQKAKERRVAGKTLLPLTTPMMMIKEETMKARRRKMRKLKRKRRRCS